LPSGRPLILISSLARHTMNLRANHAASLLIADPAPADGDPLAGARASLSGCFEQLEDAAAVAEARERFIAVHPAAAGYAGFGDFGWWAMSIASAHLVAGFGRIRTISGSDLATEAVAG
jgi:putative heme iron utilization protein